MLTSGDWIRSKTRIAVAVSFAIVGTTVASAQNCLNAKQTTPAAQTASPAGLATQSGSAAAGQPAAPARSSQSSDDSEGQQTKRILWIIPNYRAVSANCQLPPLSVKEKFVLATQDSFDYSAFIIAGMLAGYSMATNAYPEFHQGAAGYGRYYWHSFADQAMGNYFTEAIVPSLSHEDPRYYTLGSGGFVHRTGYAISRLIVTRTDPGGKSFNFSEIVGNAAGAGLSNAYYPSRERTAGNTASKWATQIGVDGIANVLKEYWPDIRRKVFHQ
ncbi:MAG TPA: hypothetical protein VF740_15465 [Candidatus Acidoferrum sp.]